MWRNYRKSRSNWNVRHGFVKNKSYNRIALFDDISSIIKYYKGAITINDYFNLECYVIRSLKTQIIKENLITIEERKIDEKYSKDKKNNINISKLKSNISVLFYYSQIINKNNNKGK